MSATWMTIGSWKTAHLVRDYRTTPRWTLCGREITAPTTADVTDMPRCGQCETRADRDGIATSSSTATAAQDRATEHAGTGATA